jgi:hypothetical protein
MTYPDPKYAQILGVGPGGGGGTHRYANLADIMNIDSPQARLFVLVVTLSALAEYAEGIRDQHPAAYRAASEGLTAGTVQVTQMIGMSGGTAS